MRILMVGDVVGKPGRLAAQEWIPRLRSKYAVDFVIVNGENAAAGIGITPDIADTFFDRSETDVVTLGNHAWGKRDIFPYLEEESRILRPINYPAGAPGRGWGIFQSSAGKVGVVSLQGRVFMENIDDPFRAADVVLSEIRKETKVIFIDFHAEATSEKIAFGFYVDGRASAVVGTHTHVQTADARILPKGTAFLTDVGMTGPVDSIIGMKREIVIPKFLNALPARFEVADGDAQLSAVLVDIDIESGIAHSIETIQVPSHTDIRLASQQRPVTSGLFE